MNLSYLNFKYYYMLAMFLSMAFVIFSNPYLNYTYLFPAALISFLLANPDLDLLAKTAKQKTSIGITDVFSVRSLQKQKSKSLLKSFIYIILNIAIWYQIANYFLG